MNIVNHLADTDESYSKAIDSLAQYYASASSYRPAMISGGERKDWFFSIPVARKLNLPHIFLFKNGDYIVSDHQGNRLDLDVNGQRVLHVADIINLASSYLKRWIPQLKALGAEFTETLSVAVRNQEGVKSLETKQVSVVSPLVVGRTLFEDALRLGLINEFAFNEIRLFDESAEEWTRRYLTECGEGLVGCVNESAATKERIAWFKSTDPYRLKGEYAWFFA